MENRSELVIYTTEDGLTKVDVTFENETVWLTQEQMSELFQRDRSVITKHIRNIFTEGELDEKSNVQFLHIANSGKPVKYYNLDVIISVGYRVKSLRGTQFRIWAINILKEYMLKGFAMDDERLKGHGGGAYWKELLERIRDIRSMDDYIKQLDAVLSSGSRELLEGSGSVSHAQALQKAKTEYGKYRNENLSPVEKAYFESIKATEKTAKKKLRETKTEN